MFDTVRQAKQIVKEVKAPVRPNAIVKNTPDADFYKDYVHDFEKEYDNYVKTSFIALVEGITLFSLIAGMIFHPLFACFLLLAFPIGKLVKMFIHNYRMEKDLAEAMNGENEGYWHCNFTLFDNYDPVVKIKKKIKHETVQKYVKIDDLSSTLKTEMAHDFEIISMDEVKIPRENLVKMIDSNNEIDPAELGKFINEFYEVSGKPIIVGNENALVTYEPEFEMIDVETDKIIYKKAGYILDITKDYFDPNDPNITAEYETKKVPDVTKPTGNSWKYVNGVCVDSNPIENANIDVNSPKVYRVIVGRFFEMRVKSQVEKMDDDYYELRTWFVITPGPKDRCLKYIPGTVPQNGFQIDIGHYEEVGLRLEYITAKNIVIFTMVDCWGIRHKDYKILQYNSTNIRDKIIHVLANKVQDDEISIIGKEQDYLEQGKRLDDLFDARLHDQGLSIDKAKPVEDMDDLIKKHEIPAPPEQAYVWAQQKRDIGLSFLGGIGLTSVLFMILIFTHVL